MFVGCLDCHALLGPEADNRSNKNVRGHARCNPAGLRQQQLAEGMAKKDGVIEIEGVVTEALPNAMFRVELTNKQHYPVRR